MRPYLKDRIFQTVCFSLVLRPLSMWHIVIDLDYFSEIQRNLEILVNANKKYRAKYISFVKFWCIRKLPNEHTNVCACTVYNVTRTYPMSEHLVYT